VDCTGAEDDTVVTSAVALVVILGLTGGLAMVIAVELTTGWQRL